MYHSNIEIYLVDFTAKKISLLGKLWISSDYKYYRVSLWYNMLKEHVGIQNQVSNFIDLL